MSTLLDLKSLQIVAAVAESGSMLEASQRFGMTQSAVSQAVRRAEAAEDARPAVEEQRTGPLDEVPGVGAAGFSGTEVQRRYQYRR